MKEVKFTYALTPNLSDGKELVELNEKWLLGKIGFCFVDGHKGFRPGKIHVLLARTSAGKTSLARSLFNKMTFEHRCLWYSSEETLNDWKIKSHDNKVQKEDNIRFIQEHDIKKIIKSPKEFLAFLEMQIETEKIKFFIFDNITTTKFYNDITPKEQSDFLHDFKSLIMKLNVAALILAHVSGSCRNKTFSSSDVRGNKTISNLAEYWYNMHRFVCPNELGHDVFVSVVHVEKSRSHKNSDSVYALKYDRDNGYVSDKEINWKVLKGFLKEDMKTQ